MVFPSGTRVRRFNLPRLASCLFLLRRSSLWPLPLPPFWPFSSVTLKTRYPLSAARKDSPDDHRIRFNSYARSAVSHNQVFFLHSREARHLVHYSNRTWKLSPLLSSIFPFHLSAPAMRPPDSGSTQTPMHATVGIRNDGTSALRLSLLPLPHSVPRRPGIPLAEYRFELLLFSKICQREIYPPPPFWWSSFSSSADS